MIRYRLCFINPNTGQVDREREIEAADDVDAVRLAGLVRPSPARIWCENRKVRSFAAREASSVRRLKTELRAQKKSGGAFRHRRCLSHSVSRDD
jgi:hypothetical protein